MTVNLFIGLLAMFVWCLAYIAGIKIRNFWLFLLYEAVVILFLLVLCFFNK